MLRVYLVFLIALAQSSTLSAADDPVLLDKVVAIVDEDIVMLSEVKQRAKAISQRLQRQGTNVPPLTILETRVLEQLILESIQLQKAERAGIRVSDDQLNETISNIARSNNMTIDQFADQVRLEGDTYVNARKQIRNEMIITRTQQREVERRVRVSEQEIKSFLESKEGRQQSGNEYLIGHILIAAPEDATEGQLSDARARANEILNRLKSGADFKETAITDSDGRNALEGGIIGWRKENELPSIAANVIPRLKEGQPSELIKTASGFHILSPLEKRGGEAKIIDQYLTRHILISPSEIRTDEEAQAIATNLRERILEGESFTVLARSNSDDPVSAIDGGSLDWVSQGAMVPEFESVMLGIPVNEISEPFKTEFGWHILQVTEKRKHDVGAMLQNSQARQVLHRRKFEEELSLWLQEIKSEAYVEIKDERYKEIES